ncbi:hypothetical protein ACFL0S_01520 [Thermodesulfobacteriota bacterium]
MSETLLIYQQQKPQLIKVAPDGETFIRDVVSRLRRFVNSRTSPEHIEDVSLYIEPIAAINLRNAITNYV